jgi:uncharacterized membrane protein
MHTYQSAGGFRLELPVNDEREIWAILAAHHYRGECVAPATLQLVFETIEYSGERTGLKLMENFEVFIFARTLHVLAVVIWIGGVAFVTTILLPALKQMPNATDKLVLFEQLEGRFALQARVVTLMAGSSGYYMLDYMDAWERYLQLQFWWMHLMTIIWAIFTLVLFVLEPLVLHRWFREQAIQDSENAFSWLHRMHKILLTLSLLAVFGAVAGSHGFSF